MKLSLKALLQMVDVWEKINSMVKKMLNQNWVFGKTRQWVFSNKTEQFLKKISHTNLTTLFAICQTLLPFI